MLLPLPTRRQSLQCSKISKMETILLNDSENSVQSAAEMIKNGEVVGVLDIDSPVFDRFSENDRAGLEEFARIIEKVI